MIKRQPTEGKTTIGQVCLESMLNGSNNEEALADILAQFPNAKTTINTVSWYRNKFRCEGHPIFTARELRIADAKRKGRKKK